MGGNPNQSSNLAMARNPAVARQNKCSVDKSRTYIFSGCLRFPISEIDHIQWKTVSKFNRETTSERPNSHMVPKSVSWSRSQFPGPEVSFLPGKSTPRAAKSEDGQAGELPGTFLPRLFGIQSGARRLKSPR